MSKETMHLIFPKLGNMPHDSWQRTNKSNESLKKSHVDTLWQKEKVPIKLLYTQVAILNMLSLSLFFKTTNNL